MMPHIYIIFGNEFFEKKREREKVLASVITRNDQRRLVPKNDIFATLHGKELVTLDIHLDEVRPKVA